MMLKRNTRKKSSGLLFSTKRFNGKTESAAESLVEMLHRGFIGLKTDIYAGQTKTGKSTIESAGIFSVIPCLSELGFKHLLDESWLVCVAL